MALFGCYNVTFQSINVILFTYEEEWDIQYNFFVAKTGSAKISDKERILGMIQVYDTFFKGTWLMLRMWNVVLNIMYTLIVVIKSKHPNSIKGMYFILKYGPMIWIIYEWRQLIFFRQAGSICWRSLVHLQGRTATGDEGITCGPILLFHK